VSKHVTSAIVLIMLLTATAGCGQPTPTPQPTRISTSTPTPTLTPIPNETFSAYGFSFQYPEAYSMFQGRKFYGIVGAFYCEESQIAFTLQTMTERPRTENELYEEFQSYMEYFNCHDDEP
jgi:hypothetical protein